MADTKLIVKVHGQAIEIELDFAYRAEARIREIAYVNKQTAPELCATFGDAYARLATSMGQLMYQLGQAEIAVKRRKAIIMIDDMPGLIAAAKLGKVNEDIREGFCYKDEEYLAAKDAQVALDAARETIYLKMTALRMAFEATKSILKDGYMPGERGGVTETPDLPIREAVGTGSQENTYKGGWYKPKV